MNWYKETDLVIIIGNETVFYVLRIFYGLNIGSCKDQLCINGYIQKMLYFIIKVLTRFSFYDII